MVPGRGDRHSVLSRPWSASQVLLAGLTAGYFLVLALIVFAGELAFWLWFQRWPTLQPSVAVQLASILANNPTRIWQHWPVSGAGSRPPYWLCWVLLLSLTTTLGSMGAWALNKANGFRAWSHNPLQTFLQPLHTGLTKRFGLASLARGITKRKFKPPRRGNGVGAGTAQWARKRDLVALRVSHPVAGRLSLGTYGRSLLAAELTQSLIVVGPTQTMKTSGLAIPSILEWDGPVVAASVKGDLLHDTVQLRSGRGEVWIFDPASVTGLASATWSPLYAAATWQGARRVALSLCNASREGSSGITDGDFWYATAAKMMAPLLLAAALSDLSMADVVAWVEEQESAEVEQLLIKYGQAEALRAARASWGREERQRSSIYTTVEIVLDAFSEAEPSQLRKIDPQRLVKDGSTTLYMCAPSHDQSRLRPVFSSLTTEILRYALEESSRSGKPLDPPLLIVLDEAANIAPVNELDSLASTAASHGIQLVTVWQDMAQIQARYGARASTVFNNHRAKLVLSGVSDPITLEQVSTLVGDTESSSDSQTVDRKGNRSTTTSLANHRLAPPDYLRRIEPGTGVLIYGHLPPIRLRLRPFFSDRRLSAMARGLQAPPK